MYYHIKIRLGLEFIGGVVLYMVQVQVYEPECLVTLLPSSVCLLTNHFTLFQHEHDESP